jgi:hypothetical protein
MRARLGERRRSSPGSGAVPSRSGQEGRAGPDRRGRQHRHIPPLRRHGEPQRHFLAQSPRDRFGKGHWPPKSRWTVPRLICYVPSHKDLVIFGYLYFAGLRPEEAVCLGKANLSLPRASWDENTHT